jgi:hypothetical protein
LALIEDLIADDSKKRNHAKASIMSLIPQGFPALIKKFPLTCQTIGLKFIRADIENHHKRGPRYFNYHGFQNFCRQLKIVLQDIERIKASKKKP